MIPTIQNKKHKKALFAAMLFSLVIGLVTLLATKTNAAIVTTTDEQTDSVKATPKTDSADANKIYTDVERPAEFPGGLDGWRAYLQKNLKYPKKAQKNGTQGEVKIKMTVDKNGNVTNLILQRDPGDGLGDEAMRVIEKGPKWIPAWQKGRNVTYRFTQTVTFQLQ